jgi:subtilase family serine protease
MASASASALKRCVAVFTIVSVGTLLVSGAGVDRYPGSTTPDGGGRMTPTVATATRFIPGRPGASSADGFYCATTTPALCQVPNTIRSAYGFDKLAAVGLTGKGRTIVIVDAYTSPTITSDLRSFARQFGLPKANLRQIAPDGVPPYDVNDEDQAGWAGEISLDVEWAHAVATQANIVLVSAKSDEDADMISAVRYAVRHDLGDVISQSFYENELCMSASNRADLHRVYEEATAKGITLLASSGDVGAAQYDCNDDGLARGVAVPAADPLVTGVGGTTLSVAGGSGSYLGESTWTGSGGGVSALYRRPAFQSGSGLAGRGVPDVSYEADGATGPLVVWSSSPYDYGPVFVFEGTSVGAPQWAGLVAITDQLHRGRVGTLNPTLYALARDSHVYGAAFHDVTAGDNSFPIDDSTTIEGYAATRGYDLSTGLGSPRAERLAPLLAAAG